jgi:hypothetical protein
MTEVYAMRRANGDWFALERHGRLRVPLFHSSQDALMSRLRNFGMLLFEPVALDAKLLETMTPLGDSDVDFCIVKDPFANLKRSSVIEPSELALMINSPLEVQAVQGNGNGQHASAIVNSRQSEWWNWDVAKRKEKAVQ